MEKEYKPAEEYKDREDIHPHQPTWARLSMEGTMIGTIVTLILVVALAVWVASRSFLSALGIALFLIACLVVWLRTRPSGARGNPELAYEVKDALEVDPRVNEHLINVEVVAGIAYLTGRQDSTLARDAAGEDAGTVPGVKAVQNKIEVIPSV